MMAEFAATRTGAAQSPEPSAATAQQFEVVSIKPNPNAAGPLVQHAYNVKDFQRLGAPGWIHTERFDSRGSFSGVAMRLSARTFRALRHASRSTQPWALTGSSADSRHRTRRRTQDVHDIREVEACSVPARQAS